MKTEFDTKELGVLATAISAECAALQSGNGELAKLATRVRELVQRASGLSDDEAPAPLPPTPKDNIDGAVLANEELQRRLAASSRRI